MAVFYNRLVHRNKFKAGFTSSNTETTTQAVVVKDVALRAGLTVNEDLTDAVSVTVSPGAGG
jgi:hypothetical protein